MKEFEFNYCPACGAHVHSGDEPDSETHVDVTCFGCGRQWQWSFWPKDQQSIGMYVEKPPVYLPDEETPGL